MIRIFKQKVPIRKIVLVVIILSVITIGLIFLFFVSDNKISNLIAGAASGLAVSIVQLILSWEDYVQNEKFSDLKLIKVLDKRDERDKYQRYIQGSTQEIDLMGVTASRFFRDFADLDREATEDAKVILNALERNVRIRVLLPNRSFLPNDKQADFDAVKCCVEKIREKYNDKIELRYFDHIPAHSILKVDDECIVGPIFPGLSSKYTPALHLKTKSHYALKYIEYFDREWKECEK